MNATSGLPSLNLKNTLTRLAVLAVLFLVGAVWADDQPATNKTSAPAARETPAPKTTRTLSAGFEEVVAMSEAGVSKDLLIQFVETSARIAQPSGADIIAMKARGLPDEVIVTMMHRSIAQAREARARQTVAAPAIVRQLSTDGQLDPDSYEFFWYHYAYPRALASSYRTLAPYSPSYYQRYGRNRVPWRNDGFPRDSLVQERPASARLVAPRH